MNLERHIARLDGYEGELARSHAKLVLEKDGGHIALAEEVDFLNDFRAAAHRRDVAPWRGRALAAAIVGAVLALAAAGLTLRLHRIGPAGLGLVAAALLLEVLALVCVHTLHKRSRLEREWFVTAMVALQDGASIFDLRWDALATNSDAKADGDKAA